MRADEVNLHVPALCDIEIAAGLRRAAMHKSLSPRRASEALQDYLDLPLMRHGHRSLLRRVLDLRANFSAYHATYVALAELLDATLLTADAGLARATRARTSVTVLP